LGCVFKKPWGPSPPRTKPNKREKTLTYYPYLIPMP